jgi:hypothetical protein
MTADPSSQAGDHRRFAAGILSRYAPHFLLWGIFFAIGLLLGLLGLSRPASGTLLPGVLLLLASFAFLIPLFIALARSPRWARTSKEGVQWQDGRGDHLWRWEEIAAVFRLDKIINQTFRVKQLRLVPAQGEEVTFDQCLSDYDGLADAVQDAVANRLLPAKRAELASAGATFGPVTLHRDGLTINAKKLTWPEVEQYTIFRGSLVVCPRGSKGFEEVGLSGVPNYPVLLHLLQELGQMPVPPQQNILFTGRR